MTQTDLEKDIFAMLNDADNGTTLFSDTNAGTVEDWIPSLLPELDKVLSGGIPLRYVSEFYGKASVGKAIVHKTPIPYQTSEGTVGFKPIEEIKVGDMVFNRLGKPVKVKGVFPQENKLEVFKVKLDDNRALLVNDEHLWGIVTPSGYKTVTTHEIMHMLANGEHVYIPRNHTVKTDDDPTLSKRKDEFKEKYHISSRTTDTEILFNSSNEACDCVGFARELGYKATPHYTPSKEQYKVHITNYTENKIEVKSVTDLGFKRGMTCLYVDDPEHLFMAGDFIVTHNTTISGSFIKNFQKMPHTYTVYIDVEGTTGQDRLLELGIDPSRVITKRPSKLKDGTVKPITIETAGSYIIDTLALLKKSDPKASVLFIWDSIGASISDFEQKQGIDNMTVGQKAKALANIASRIAPNLQDNNGALISFNQARDDINSSMPAMYKQTLTTGGRAWEHLLSTRLEIKNGTKITKTSTDKEAIGKHSKIVVKKSKIGDTWSNQIDLALMGKSGYDFVYNTVLTGQNMGLVTKGASPKYDDGTYNVKGRSLYRLVEEFRKEENHDALITLWQRELLTCFPTVYPAIFNVHAVMTEKAFPMIKGLRRYYIEQQQKLPVAEQSYNYKHFMNFYTQGKLPDDLAEEVQNDLDAINMEAEEQDE